MARRVLDLFCGAGGAAMGYRRAGFEVVGVDTRPQPHYPFEFHQGDALEFLDSFGLGGFDLIHASPPCQAYSVTRRVVEQKLGPREYPELIPAVRKALHDTGKLYVIENVPGAPLVDPVRLCGLMFGLRVIRWRLFEANFYVMTPPCPTKPRGHTTNAYKGYSTLDRAAYIGVYGNCFRLRDAQVAMGIDWPMTRKEIAQAIPPAYTEHIGRFAMSRLDLTRR